MEIKKLIYKYDDLNGGYKIVNEKGEKVSANYYEFLPTEADIKDDKEHIVKVIRKNENLFIFKVKSKSSKKDRNNRDVKRDIIIYEIEYFKQEYIDSILEELNINKNISDIEKKFLIKNIKNLQQIDFFISEYFPFLLLKINDFEFSLKKKLPDFLEDNFVLKKLENEIYKNFNEDLIKDYFVFSNKKRIGKFIASYLDENLFLEYLNDKGKKELYEQCKKLNIELTKEIFLENSYIIKKKCLLKFINQANEKEIDKLLKAMSKKIIIGI